MHLQITAHLARRNEFLAQNMRRKMRTGVAAVELAIWLPFLSLMFAVVLEFCRAYYVTQTIQTAAEAAAMYSSGASVPPPGTAQNTAAVQAAVAQGVSLNPPLSASNVSITQSGNQIQVTVTYQYSTLLSFPNPPSNVTFSSSVTMATVPQAGS
jgi:Flp pilus assembly protein TadG